MSAEIPRDGTDGPSDSIDITLLPLNDSTWQSPVGADRPADLPLGLLPGYEIIRELHRGGQGIVFLANQKSMERKVAIKVMREGPFADPTERARFDREVHILAQLQHPNIVTIHDSGRVAGCDYFVMDYIEGMSLDEYVEQRKPPLRQLLELFQTICETVEVAHAQNIIHRDLKPGNIRVDTKDRPRVLDFGLAKVVGGPRGTAATEQGMFVGSIPWASPEQARGELETLDPRTDVYSLGVILYQLLTNRFPYDVVGPPHEALDRIISAEPIRPRLLNGKFDRDLETIILKCLAKDRERRYASAGQIAADLHRFRRGEPIAARRDSFTYLVRVRSRAFAASYPLTMQMLAFLAACAATLLIVIPLDIHWTPLERNFRRIAMRLAAPSVPAERLKHVRILALTERTSIDELARSERLQDVSSTNKQSWRRLHGRLMQRLAAAQPRAVAWDIRFTSPSHFDDDFVTGVRSLLAVGTGVAVAAPGFGVGPNGLPGVNPTILAACVSGSDTADMSGIAPWAVDLALARPGEPARPSFSLAAVASSRHPLAEFDPEIDALACTLRLYYWKPNPIVARARQSVDAPEDFDLTSVRCFDRPDRDDVIAGDCVAIFGIQVPPEPVLAASTLEYADAMRADDATLRSWFRDRVVVAADCRQGVDRHPYPDGREVPGCVGQAVAIDALLSSASIRMPRLIERFLVVAGAAALGIVLARILDRQAGRRLIALTALSLTSIILSLLVLRAFGYLCNPLIPLAAAIIACELSAAIWRFVPPRTV